MGLAYSLSHNSIKYFLFILKFSFHSSTLVLLFKMFAHQMFVLPAWSTPYTLLLWRSSFNPFQMQFSSLFWLIKCLDGYSFFFCYVINIEFKTKVLLQSSTKGGHLVLVPDAGGKQSEGGICCYICNHLRMKKNSFTALNSSVIHQF